MSDCGGRPTKAATVTITKAGAPVGTCTTAIGLDTLTLIVGGSGYTNGTGYAIGLSGGGGTGAAGTFDVVGGVVTNLQVTAAGSGYTSAPLVSFPGAGSGSGAAASSTIAGKCCIPISSAGTYSYSVSKARFTTVSGSIVATCTGSSVNTVTATTLSAATGYVCCSKCEYPLPTTLYLTDSAGTHTCTWNGSIWVTGCDDSSGRPIQYQVECLGPATDPFVARQTYDDVGKTCTFMLGHPCDGFSTVGVRIASADLTHTCPIPFSASGTWPSVGHCGGAGNPDKAVAISGSFTVSE